MYGDLKTRADRMKKSVKSVALDNAKAGAKKTLSKEHKGYKKSMAHFMKTEKFISPTKK